MSPSVIFQPGSDSKGERRSGPDRRKKGSSNLLAPFIHARRSHIRRQSDHRAFTLLDRYENLRLSAIAFVLPIQWLSFSPGARGIFTMKRLPFPGELSIVNPPPMAWARSRKLINPNPLA